MDPPGVGAWNLAVDEAILDAYAAAEPRPPTLRLYGWSPPAYSLGKAQSARGSCDADGDALEWRWFVYPEAGSGSVDARIEAADAQTATFTAPSSEADVHVILVVRDDGSPPLAAYRRVIFRVRK